jgi:endonuclease-3
MKMKKETKKPDTERGTLVAAELGKLYPDSACSLDWGGGEAWRLMVMGRLSAQCTDARVNIVCKDLFEKYPTLSSLADAPLENIENIVRPCGLYRTKAASIKAACIKLRDEYGGELPRDVEKLCEFPGVGRKIANLLLGDVFGKEAIVCDTHCIRICGRFGMYPETLKDPVKVERLMDALLPMELRCDFCHRIVQFGRDTCSARAPMCGACPLNALCEHARQRKQKEAKA